MSPARRRRVVLMLQDRFGVSERWACRVVGQHRSTQCHRPDPVDADLVLRARLREISAERPRWGYRRAHVRLGELGHSVNRKRVQRLWREEGLRVPARRRKRQRLGESTVPAARLRAERPDHVWALDFQFDQTADGRVLKLLNVVDEFLLRTAVFPAEDARLARPKRLSQRRQSGSRPGSPSRLAALPLSMDRNSHLVAAAFHGCRSGRASHRAPPGACSSSDAGISSEASETAARPERSSPSPECRFPPEAW